MSNPAVTKLVKTRLGGHSVWMDDNIGESIHIHIDDIRLDLTSDELHQLSGELCEVINAYVNVEGFDVRKINPIYFSLLLYEWMPYLKRVEYDTIFLEDILVPKPLKFGMHRYISLKDSRGVKALNGDTRENDKWRPSHHINQTSRERMQVVLDSIKEHGYPYNDEYLIFYNDQNNIRDGQHRAACLYYLYGNIEVPIMRLYFEEGAKVQIEKSLFVQFLHVIFPITPKRIRKLLSVCYHRLRAFCNSRHRKGYEFLNRRIVEEMKKEFF